jgi:hypothetical protein
MASPYRYGRETMKEHAKIGTIIFGALVLVTMAGAGDGREARRDGHPRDLVLRLSVAKSAFVQYEPVPLRYSVTNPTKVWIRSQVVMDFAAQQTLLFISRDGGKPVQYFGGVVACSGAGPGGDTTHEPGQTLEREVVLFRNDRTGELAFPSPGHYDITGRTLVGFDPEGEGLFAEAAPVGVDVAAPGNIDQRLAERLGSTERLIELLDHGAGRFCEKEPRAACFAELRQALERFPESAYAAQITFDLADTLSWAHNPAADYKQAAELFDEFLNRWPADLRGPDALRFGAAAWVRAGRADIAVEWTDRFARRYPARKQELKEMQETLGPFRPKPAATDANGAAE